jgi:1,4-alpha-glucan branching enzyme
VRQGYRIGVPCRGRYLEVFNSDSRFYGGSDTGNALAIQSESMPFMGRPESLTLTLPPLGALILRLLSEE